MRPALAVEAASASGLVTVIGCINSSSRSFNSVGIATVGAAVGGESS